MTSSINAYAYVIFPTVGKGGPVIGGSYGHGEVYQGRTLIGYADISQATIGTSYGGEGLPRSSRSRTKAAFDSFKEASSKFAASASAVAVKTGMRTPPTARYPATASPLRRARVG